MKVSLTSPHSMAQKVGLFRQWQLWQSTYITQTVVNFSLLCLSLLKFVLCCARISLRNTTLHIFSNQMAFLDMLSAATLLDFCYWRENINFICYVVFSFCLLPYRLSGLPTIPMPGGRHFTHGGFFFLGLLSIVLLLQ